MILAFSGQPAQRRLGGGRGHHHRARASLREPPACPVRRERLRLNRYRDPARLSRSAPGCSTTAHQIGGGCPAGHGQPPVRTEAENGVR
jgi:hypothetical protein